jgi:hypothetical protein
MNDAPAPVSALTQRLARAFQVLTDRDRSQATGAPLHPVGICVSSVSGLEFGLAAALRAHGFNRCL